MPELNYGVWDFLSTYSVLRYLESNPVSSMSTTMVMSIFVQQISQYWGTVDPFDTLLYVLIVRVKFTYAVIGLETRIVVSNDTGECNFLAFRVLLVIFFFLRQIFLYLLNIFVSFRRWGKNTCYVQWSKFSILFCIFVWMLLNNSKYSMASLMLAVASIALNLRPLVAESCLERMVSITLDLAMPSPGLGGFFPSGLK